MQHLKPNYHLHMSIPMEVLSGTPVSLNDFEDKLSKFLIQLSILAGCHTCVERDSHGYSFEVSIECSELLAPGIEHRLNNIIRAPYIDEVYEVDAVCSTASGVREVAIMTPRIPISTHTVEPSPDIEVIRKPADKGRKIFIDIK